MTKRSDDPGAPSADRGVYGISVAGELSGVPVQSLRLYERHGLLSPSRSDGGTRRYSAPRGSPTPPRGAGAPRRYSADDLTRLRRISELVDAGVNLAGIGRILDLQDDNAALQAANPAADSKNNTNP